MNTVTTVTLLRKTEASVAVSVFGRTVADSLKRSVNLTAYFLRKLCNSYLRPLMHFVFC